MKKIFALILVAVVGNVMFADESENDAAPQEAEKPAVKVLKPSYSISMKQYPLISKKEGNDNARNLNGFNSLSGSKTTTYQMKWYAAVRVRGNAPDDLVLSVYYIAQNAENAWVQVGDTVEHKITLDDKGTWKQELLSPVTTWKEHKKQKNVRFQTNNDTTPEKQGERIKGCIAQLKAGGEIVKSFSSDPRWKKAAESENFSIEEINQRKGKIGVR